MNSLNKLNNCSEDVFSVEQNSFDFAEESQNSQKCGSSKLEKTINGERIFSIAKKCDSKKRKHMLRYEQISVLENYFHKDPKWTSATIGEYNLLLNLY